MANEPENLTLRLLQELRDDMRGMRSEMQEVNEKLADMVQRVDGNTLVFNLVAGVVHDHEQRIDQLEGR